MNLLNLINLSIMARPIFDEHTYVTNKIDLISRLSSAKYLMSSTKKSEMYFFNKEEDLTIEKVALDIELKTLKDKNLTIKEMAEEFATNTLKDFTNNLDEELKAKYFIAGSGSILGYHNKYKSIIINPNERYSKYDAKGLQINADVFVMLDYINRMILGLALIYGYVKEEDIETKYIPLLLQMLGLGFGVLKTTTNKASDKKIIDIVYNYKENDDDSKDLILLQDKIEEVILKEFGRQSVISTLMHMFINKKTNNLAPDKFKKIFINFFENDMDKEIVYT